LFHETGPSGNLLRAAPLREKTAQGCEIMRKDQDGGTNGSGERQPSSREVLRSLFSELLPAWLKRERVRPETASGRPEAARRFRIKR
jgi:hypothetical protein